MSNGLKTLNQIQTEEEALLARIGAIESQLCDLHAREWELRTDLARLGYQRERLEKIEPVAEPQAQVGA